MITLWPGHAAEEVERLITIPLENELNGIADVTFLRSDTLLRPVEHQGPVRRRHRQLLGPPAGPGAHRPGRPARRRQAGAGAAVERDRRGVPLHARIEDDAADRAEGAAELGAGARVPQGPRRRRRRLVGRRHQAVSGQRRSRPGCAATTSPSKQVFDAVAANNSNAGGSYVPPGPVRADGARHRLFQSAARHRERRGGRAEGHAGARARRRRRWRSATRIRLGCPRPRPRRRPRAGHRAHAQGREPRACHRGAEGRAAGDPEAAAGRRRRSGRTTAATCWCGARSPPCCGTSWRAPPS